MAEEKKIQEEELKAETAAEVKEEQAQETETEEPTAAEKTEAGDTEASAGENEKEESAEQGNGASDSTNKNAEEPTAEEAKAAEESERYMRLMAEFQNFKKRAAKEKSDIHAYANEKLMNELLPVLDNFERALETKTDEVEGYAKGMELIFQQMKSALENHGLKEITALGEDFDPNKHSAVMTEETEEFESGKVSKVFQKGYELNGRVIRPSMVAVSK